MAMAHDVFAGRRAAERCVAVPLGSGAAVTSAPTPLAAPEPRGARRFAWAAMPLGPATSPDRLRELSQAACLALRERVAAHPATPPDVLARLALEPSAGVRLRVARHPNTPASIRLGLSADEHPSVRRAARPPNRAGVRLAA